MKPRITLAETQLTDGAKLLLEEHDGRRSLTVHGQQICGPSTRSAESELARLGCAPFRPARQPTIWIAGLGLGHMLASAASEIHAKRANFIVAEPVAAIPEWHREFLPDSPFNTDPRVSLENDCTPAALARKQGELHAILLHLDASPLASDNRPWPEHRTWLAAAYDSLQQGGLLAIAASRPDAAMTKRLRQTGFDVAEYTVPASPGAKKSRMLPIWLGRKGKYAG